MKKFLTDSKGFTLVELMVVVAIIGILSAIAVPNFKKYQAKSKQSEAKIQLAAIYSSEVGANSDYDTYATCLTDIGYEAAPRGYYMVGFSAAAAAPNGIIVARGGACASAANIIPGGLALKADAAAAAIVAGNLASVAPTSTVFTASAAGNISTAAARDVWTITQTKALNNPTIGY